MQRIAILMFLCILIASTTVACGQTAPLCGSAGYVDRNEIAFLPKAPHGAKRIGKHTLEVNWAKGIRRFVDKDCSEGYIGGSCWEYRGYCASLHLHQINHEEDDLFTGVLLDDVSGKLLPGGALVFFSPDGKKYLASSQWNGKELSGSSIQERGPCFGRAIAGSKVRMVDFFRSLKTLHGLQRESYLSIVRIWLQGKNPF